MSIRERLSGNEATAIAMKQINPDVVAALHHQQKYHNIFQHLYQMEK